MSWKIFLLRSQIRIKPSRVRIFYCNVLWRKNRFLTCHLFFFSEPVPKKDITNNPTNLDAVTHEGDILAPILPVKAPVRVAPLPPNIVPPIPPRVMVPKPIAEEDDQRRESGDNLLIQPSTSINIINND